MMSKKESAMAGFPEVWRSYLFTQLAAVEVSELFPIEAHFSVGSIALGWDWIL